MGYVVGWLSSHMTTCSTITVNFRCCLLCAHKSKGEGMGGKRHSDGGSKASPRLNIVEGVFVIYADIPCVCKLASKTDYVLI